jgi:hypothetical protein
MSIGNRVRSPRVIGSLPSTTLNDSELNFCEIRRLDLATRQLDKRTKRGAIKANIIKALSDGNIVSVSSRVVMNKVVGWFPEGKLVRIDIQNGRVLGRQLIALNNLIKPEDIIGAAIDEDPSLIRQMANSTTDFYSQFPISKKDGGERWINAPNDDLKRVQNKILHKILYSWWATKNAHGFVCKRSPVTNARMHVGKRIVINMDLKSFFDTITIDMVKSHLAELLQADSVFCIDLLADLLTYPIKTFRVKTSFTPQDSLFNDSSNPSFAREEIETRTTPQGAPTSPAISNIVARWMDFALRGLARKFDAVYTRYADDLTFSSDNTQLPRIIPIVTKVVNSHGFWVNTKKTNVFRRGGRQMVTGLVVNDHPNVPRKRRMELRACLHNIITGKTSFEEVDIPKLRGEVNWINQANPQQGKKFLDQFKEVLTLCQEDA